MGVILDVNERNEDVKWWHTQLEEGIRNLEHKDMRVAVIMDDENTLDRPTHTKILIVILEALKTRRDRGIFLRLCFFCA
jgi:hypothetical protein